MRVRRVVGLIDKMRPNCSCSTIVTDHWLTLPKSTVQQSALVGRRDHPFDCHQEHHRSLREC